jgi:hypothetical protein
LRELREGKLAEARRHLIVAGQYVEGVSGMTCVIPAWQIMEVLDMPILKKLRHPGMVAAQKARAAQPKPESAAPAAPDGDANPEHLTGR